MPIAHHVMLRTEERRVLAPSVAQRRALAAAVHGVAGRTLLAFRGSDTHVHLLLLADRVSPGRTAQALAVALHARLGLRAPFEPARIKPVANQSHLESAFDYILRQDERHGFGSDPWHDASVLPDLLGLRALGGDVQERVQEHLPRVEHRRLIALLGVEALHAGRDAGLAQEAATAAAALTRLAGHAPRTVEARRALVAYLDGLGARQDLGRRAAWRLRKLPADPKLVRAIALQVGFREDLRARWAVEEPERLATAQVTTHSASCETPGGTSPSLPARRPLQRGARRGTWEGVGETGFEPATSTV